MDYSPQVKEFVDIAWRRKWWVLVPALSALAVSLILAGMVARTYRATTTILVTRQSLPEDIVHSTVTLRIEERMRSLQVQVFSRTYLERVAREFGLILPTADSAAIEDSCRQLRKRIFAEIDRPNFSWFRISVEDHDPKRAAGIANRLAELFIEQHSRMRASQASGTLEATGQWEEKYRMELVKRDAEIAEFKQQFLYEMPDQQAANLQLLNSSQSRANQLTSDIQSRNDRLGALRAQQQTQRAILAASGLPDVAGTDDPWLETQRRELEALLVNYTEENPLVKRKRAQIADLLRTRPADAPALAGRAANGARLDPTSLQIAALENEIRALDHDRARENVNSALYRARIGNAPRRQQQLLDLTRDYDTVKQQFNTAVAQKDQAQRSLELEESNRGEQFQVQDPAFPPSAPFRPDVLRYILSGLTLGLMLGAAAAAGREALDQTIRSEEKFRSRCPELPVYGVIPRLDAQHSPPLRSPAPARRASPRVAPASWEKVG